MALNAPNLKAKRNKLYYDITLQKNNTNAVVCCTQFTSTAIAGDRYGNLIQSLEALTGSSPSQNKARAAVSAWFTPNLISFSALGAGATAPTPQFDTFFIGPPTVIGLGSRNFTINATYKRLPTLSVGSLTPLNNLSGHDAIYSITNTGAQRHFGVAVRRRGNGQQSQSVSGTLYVQRQHSIEV